MSLFFKGGGDPSDVSCRVLCNPPSFPQPVMTRFLVAIAGVAALFALQTSSSPHRSPRPPPQTSAVLTPRSVLPCGTASLSAALPPEATVEQVTNVPGNGNYGEGASDIPYPWVPTDLPALCAVTVRVTSSPRSSYRIGLFLPKDWNGKFLAVGNSGFAGGINWIDMFVRPLSPRVPA